MKGRQNVIANKFNRGWIK